MVTNWGLARRGILARSILANTIIYLDELLTRTTVDGQKGNRTVGVGAAQEGTKLTLSCAPAMHQTESIVRSPTIANAGLRVAPIPR